MGAGFSAAKQSLSGLGGQLKSALGTAVTLGGAVSLGAFARDALQAQEAAGVIASKLRVMGDAGATAQNVLEMTRDRAAELKVTAGDVRAAYQEMLEATGNRDFASGGLAAAAQFQKVWRISATDSSKLVATLNEKLGATTQEIENELGPALLDMTNRGGIGIQDLLDGGNGLLALLPAIGARGAPGMNKLVSLLNMTDDAGGETRERMAQLQQVLIRFKDPDQLKLISKELRGMKFDEKADAVENFQKVLAAKGGEQALGKLLGGGRTAVIFKNLLQPFTEAKEEALSKGASEAKAAQAGAAKFEAVLTEQSKVALTAADMKREAAIREQEASERFRLSIAKMAEAFTKPKFLGAMDKLSESLPKLADAFVSVADLVMDNPMKAGAGALGAVVLPSAISAMFGSLLTTFLNRGKEAVADAAGGGKQVAVMNVGVMNVGSQGTGGVDPASLHRTFDPTGAASPAAKVIPAMRSFRLAQAGAAGAASLGAAALGGAAALAGGLVIGDQIRQRTIDPEQRRQLDALTIGADDALSNAQGAMFSKDTARQQSALEALRRSRKEVSGTRGGVTDVLNTFGAMISGAKGPEQLRRDKLAEISEAETRLTEQIKRRTAMEERLAKLNAENAKALEQVVKAARGVKRPPNPLPGDARVGG